MPRDQEPQTKTWIKRLVHENQANCPRLETTNTCNWGRTRAEQTKILNRWSSSSTTSQNIIPTYLLNSRELKTRYFRRWSWSSSMKVKLKKICLSSSHLVQKDLEIRKPTYWVTSIFVPIYKKRTKTQCSNYKTIALVPNANKILLHIIHERVKMYIYLEILRRASRIHAWTGHTKKKVLTKWRGTNSGGICIAGRKISNFRYPDDTTLLRKNEQN